MKIAANAVGIYSPLYAQKNVRANQAEQTSGVQTATPKAELTKGEKEFFAAMYPQEKSTVMDYHFYKKNGVISGVKVGSLFDKRG